MPAKRDDLWPEDIIDLAIEKWNAGYSASEISKLPMLGGKWTRNAVIGKINRLSQAGDPRMKRRCRDASQPLRVWSDGDDLDLLRIRDFTVNKWEWADLGVYFKTSQAECKRRFAELQNDYMRSNETGGRYGQ